MNVPLRHPQEAAKAVSLSWIALVQPCMGLWEPVIRPNGRPRVYNSADVANGIAKGFPGSTTIDMGRSPVEPSVEAIREAANPPRSIPVSFDIEAMDAYGAPQQRSSFDAWRC